MYILVVGLNHRTAPVEVREKLSFNNNNLPDFLKKLHYKPYIEGCAILSTCNRSEVYAATTDMEIALEEVLQFLSESCGLPLNQIRDYLYIHTLYDGVRHLFRVAAGLDSMILGETQILGQVRTAYEIAREAGTTNGVINTFFQQAITVGKRVRNETLIDQNAVSISYAAVELAKQSFKSLQGKTVLVVGAGKMSELTLKYLKANGVETVLVSNRSFDKAVALAKEIGGEAVKFDALFTEMEKADIVISCTAASHTIIHPRQVEEVMSLRNNQELLMIDIAVPRDIDSEVGAINCVRLFDIDDLKEVVDHNLENRRKAAGEAEKIIEQEVDEFFKWLSSLFVVPTIKALKEKANSIKEAELKRALNRLSPVSEREQRIIGSMANSIVNQLLHDVVVNLKEMAVNTRQGHLYAEILQNLFSLEVEGEAKNFSELEKIAGQKAKG